MHQYSRRWWRGGLWAPASQLPLLGQLLCLLWLSWQQVVPSEHSLYQLAQPLQQRGLSQR